MSKLSIRLPTDRHVVFPDSRAGWHPIVNYAAGPRKPAVLEQLSHEEQECARWLFARAGLNVDDYRAETVKRRLAACLRALRVQAPAEIADAVRRNPRLLNVALSTLMIGVTSFFRDPAVFATLAESVLPELLARSRSLRVWSVGCSDGAELYSVAMLLAERDVVEDCTLLGTDCRTDAIAAARQARYDPPAVKGLPPDFLRRYLSFDGIAWQMDPLLRMTTQWRVASALTICEPGAWDLILCRNMAIYMQPAATSRLWRALAQCLRQGGVLVLGKAERPLGAACLSAIAPCIYRRNRSASC